MNKIVIIGNLTADPDLKSVQTANGPVSVCNFAVAVNRRQKDRNGQDQVDFFRVTAWRGLADNCARFLAKGRKVAVTGAVSCHAYAGADGSPRAGMDVSADEVEFLTPRQDAEGRGQPQEPRPDEFTEVPSEDLPF